MVVTLPEVSGVDELKSNQVVRSSCEEVSSKYFFNSNAIFIVSSV